MKNQKIVQLYSVPEVVRILNLSHKAVRRLMAAGKLRTVKSPENLTRITDQSLEHCLLSRARIVRHRPRRRTAASKSATADPIFPLRTGS
jgi:hypothetical protein